MQIFSVKDDFPPGFYEEFTRLVVAFGRLDHLIKLCVKDMGAGGCPYVVSQGFVSDVAW
jgi:hypothetical protein